MQSLVTVNLENLKDNYNYLKSLTDKKIICVVKSDAYGQGMIKIAKTYRDLGAHGFAVFSPHEGVKLRNNGIDGLILVIGKTDEQDFYMLNRYDLCQSCVSFDYAEKLQRYFEKINKVVKVHLKIDSGMHRFGYSLNGTEIYKIIATKKMKNIAITGLYTHFSCADDINDSYTVTQYENFLKVVKIFNDDNILVHASNSSAFLNFSDISETAVRLGLCLYGFGDKNLKVVSKFTTYVQHILKVSEGDFVGYKRGYRCKTDGRIAVIPIGYYNGFNPKPSKFKVKINGKSYSVVGNVCMNHSFVWIGDDDVKTSDRVTVAETSEDYEFLSAAENKPVHAVLCALGSLNHKKYI